MKEVTINGYLLSKLQILSLRHISGLYSNTQSTAWALEYELCTHLITNIYLL